MKISKLFHWLYAILMLLPVMVFIPTAFYYGFNEQAVAQEKTEQVPVYYQSNYVNNVSDLIIERVYHYTDNYSENNNVNMNFIGIYNDDIFKNSSGIVNNNRDYIILLQTATNQIACSFGDGILINVVNIEFDFRLKEIYSPQNVNDYLINYLTICDKQYIKEYQPVTTNMSITDSMSYAWDSVWQNDLFSWSYDSFLTQPFLYITNLFNVPSTNTLLYCLSYWLNISIIWLVFDLIMYVPLLVHRWIDKGIVE